MDYGDAGFRQNAQDRVVARIRDFQLTNQTEEKDEEESLKETRGGVFLLGLPATLHATLRDVLGVRSSSLLRLPVSL